MLSLFLDATLNVVCQQFWKFDPIYRAAAPIRPNNVYNFRLLRFEVNEIAFSSIQARSYGGRFDFYCCSLWNRFIHVIASTSYGHMRIGLHPVYVSRKVIYRIAAVLLIINGEAIDCEHLQSKNSLKVVDLPCSIARLIGFHFIYVMTV